MSPRDLFAHKIAANVLRSYSTLVEFLLRNGQLLSQRLVCGDSLSSLSARLAPTASDSHTTDGLEIFVELTFLTEARELISCEIHSDFALQVNYSFGSFRHRDGIAEDI